MNIAEMLVMPGLLFGSAEQTYAQKVKALFGTALIRFWPFGEASGTVATDISGNNGDGAYTAVTLGAAGIGTDGKTAATFNGTTAFAALFTASLPAQFNVDEGAIFGWFKRSAAWSGADQEFFVLGGASGNDNIKFGRTGTNKLFTYYRGGGVSKYSEYLINNSNWQLFLISWSLSNTRVRFYLGGYLYSAIASMTHWGGALNAAVIGANTIAPNEPWAGSAQYGGILNREPTAAEVLKLATWGRPQTRFTIIGDSISTFGASVYGWVEGVRDGYKTGNCAISNHAVSGQSIVAHLPTQVLAAANDDSDVIIIHMGTNDDNGGNMSTLQAKVETALVDLKASNPRAVGNINYMNLLKRWTAVDGLTEYQLGNIRGAIAAACTAQGVTCWDTYTSPWMTAAQTVDGLHPAAAGAAAIKTQVLALLP